MALLAQQHPEGVRETLQLLPPIIFEQIQGERRKVWDSDDYQEGINAFLERREPIYRGS